jgi:hypothetical protein
MSDKKMVVLLCTVEFAEDVVRQRLQMARDYIDSLVNFPNIEDLDSTIEELRQIRGTLSDIEQRKKRAD